MRLRKLSEVMQMVKGWTLLIAIACAVSVSAADNAKSAEQKVVAVLVWGTDDENAMEKDKELKEVDPALKQKFKFLKWKHYYEVSRTKIALKADEAKRIALSKKCEILINRNESEGINLELIGEGKSLLKGKTAMPLREPLIISGDDKNATAWFVVLKPE